MILLCSDVLLVAAARVNAHTAVHVFVKNGAYQRKLLLPAKVDRPFFAAVVREMADGDRLRRSVPALPGRAPIAAGALGRIDAKPLQMDAVRGQAKGQECVAFARRLYE